MRRALIFMLATLLGGCASVQGPKGVPEKTISRVEQSTVGVTTIDVPHSIAIGGVFIKGGGGFVTEWEGQLYAVSERHTTSQGEPDFEGLEIEDTTVHQDPGADVVIPFWGSLTTNPGVHISRIDSVRGREAPQPLELAEEVSPGDEVFILGPYGRGSSGEVRYVGMDRGVHGLVAELDIHLGDSGYPIVRKRDTKVVGVLWGFAPFGWNPFGADKAAAVSSLEIREALGETDDPNQQETTP